MQLVSYQPGIFDLFLGSFMLPLMWLSRYLVIVIVLSSDMYVTVLSAIFKDVNKTKMLPSF